VGESAAHDGDDIDAGFSASDYLVHGPTGLQQQPRVVDSCR
jgi:hypothetical protein